MRLYALALLIPLAACATPRQVCERDATEEFKVVSALIVETRQNIERGYALETELRSRPNFTWCFGNHSRGIGWHWCNGSENYEVDKPVAIDADAERAKLRSLIKKRDQLRAKSDAALAQCQARYPDA